MPCSGAQQRRPAAAPRESAPRATFTSRTPCLQCPKNSRLIILRLCSSWWHVTGAGSEGGAGSSLSRQLPQPAVQQQTGERQQCAANQGAALLPAPCQLTCNEVCLPRQPRAVGRPAAPVSQHRLCRSIKLGIVRPMQPRRRQLQPALLPLAAARLRHHRRAAATGPGLAPQRRDAHPKRAQPAAGGRVTSEELGGGRHACLPLMQARQRRQPANAVPQALPLAPLLLCVAAVVCHSPHRQLLGNVSKAHNQHSLSKQRLAHRHAQLAVGYAAAAGAAGGAGVRALPACHAAGGWPPSPCRRPPCRPALTPAPPVRPPLRHGVVVPQRGHHQVNGVLRAAHGVAGAG